MDRFSYRRDSDHNDINLQKGAEKGIVSTPFTSRVAEEYLVSLQKHCPNPIRPRKEEINEDCVDPIITYWESRYGPINESMEVVRTLIRQHYRELMTQKVSDHDDPISMEIIKGVQRDVLISANQLGLKAHNNIVFGTLPSGELNAFSIKVPDSDDQVVAINRNVFVMISNISHQASLLVPINNRSDGSISFSNDLSDVESSVKANDQLPGFFTLSIISCLLGGEFSKVGYHPDPYIPQYFLGVEIIDNAFMFIVAHEYAHCVLGHTASAIRKFTTGKTEVDRIYYSWRDEIEADLYALRIVLNHNFQSRKKKGFSSLTMSYLGVDFLLSVFTLLEQIIGIEGTETHPPATMRRDALRRVIRREYWYRPMAMKTAMKTCKTMEFILFSLWERSEALCASIINNNEDGEDWHDNTKVRKHFTDLIIQSVQSQDAFLEIINTVLKQTEHIGLVLSIFESLFQKERNMIRKEKIQSLNEAFELLLLEAFNARTIDEVIALSKYFGNSHE